MEGRVAIGMLTLVRRDEEGDKVGWEMEFSRDEMALERSEDGGPTAVGRLGVSWTGYIEES